MGICILNPINSTSNFTIFHQSLSISIFLPQQIIFHRSLATGLHISSRNRVSFVEVKALSDSIDDTKDVICAGGEKEDHPKKKVAEERHFKIEQQLFAELSSHC